MVTVHTEKSYGTVRASVTAGSIERAMELAGPAAKLVFPLDPETFFAPAEAPESVAEVLTEERPAALVGAAA